MLVPWMALIVFAQAPDAGLHVMEHDVCRVGARTFELSLTSPSGQPVEDDMELRFTQGTQSTLANPRPAWMELLSPGKVPSACPTAMAVALPEENVLVLLSVNARPGLDRLAATVYDLRHRQVLDWQVVADLYEEPVRLRPMAGGISVRAVSERPHDGPEGLVQSWLDVTLEHGKIAWRWSRDQTGGLSPSQSAMLHRLLPNAQLSCGLEPCFLVGDFDGDRQADAVILAKDSSGRHLVFLRAAEAVELRFDPQPPLSAGEDCSAASCLSQWRALQRGSKGFLRLPKSVQRSAKGDVLELTWSDGAGKADVFFDGTALRKAWGGAD